MFELPEGAKTWEYTDGDHVMGRSWIWIICPWCGKGFKAYIWSLAGCGKRCPGCNAMHTHYGYAYGPNWKPEAL